MGVKSSQNLPDSIYINCRKIASQGGKCGAKKSVTCVHRNNVASSQADYGYFLFLQSAHAQLYTA